MRRGSPAVARHDGPDPQAGPARVRLDAGAPHRCRRPRRRGPREGARARRGRTRRRAGRGSPALPGHRGRVRQEPHPVRPSDRRFQAIKHKCADILLEVESAKSAAYYAGWAAADDYDELPLSPPGEVLLLGGLLPRGRENIQIHGGIGFTWEHPAHLYFKRAKSSELLFGDPAYHRELLAQGSGSERGRLATVSLTSVEVERRRGTLETSIVLPPKATSTGRCCSSATACR